MDGIVDNNCLLGHVSGMTKETSKLLSLVLRHSPEKIGIALDAAGWTPIDVLLAKLKKAGHRLDHADLMSVVEMNDKKRFTISQDGRRIRAAQGHSVPVDLGLEPVTPPDILFHGTARANLDSIFATGLNSGTRQQVHLSTSNETAFKVGSRHGSAVVLSVNAQQMVADGFAFYMADNGVWLTDAVPASYIRF